MRGSVLSNRPNAAKRLTVPANNTRQLRLSLRLGTRIKLPPSVASTERNSTVKGPIPHGVDSVLYDGIEIRGPQRYRDKVISHLKILEEETPLFYAMTRKQVKKMIWEQNKKRSYAWPRRGHIHFAQGDFETPKGIRKSTWFWLVLIHEIQHCCRQYGNGHEPAACYAMYYYGNKVKGMKADRFYLKWCKGLALKRGYDATDWELNLARLRTVPSK